MKKARKKVLSNFGSVALFVVANWKKVSAVVAIVSVSAAAYMEKLTPLADAISVWQGK